MRRYAQRRYSEWPASHACRAHQDGGVGGIPSRRTRATLPTPTVTVGHVPEVERRRSFSMRKQEDTLHPRWVKSRRLERTETILWMLEDSDNGKDDLLPRVRGRTPLSKGMRQEKMVQSRQDKPSIEGLLGKATAATESRTIEFSCKGKTHVKGKSSKGGGKRGKSKDAGALFWNQQTWKPSCDLGGVVCTADGNKHKKLA